MNSGHRLSWLKHRIPGPRQEYEAVVTQGSAIEPITEVARQSFMSEFGASLYGWATCAYSDRPSFTYWNFTPKAPGDLMDRLADGRPSRPASGWERPLPFSPRPIGHQQAN